LSATLIVGHNLLYGEAETPSGPASDSLCYNSGRTCEPICCGKVISMSQRRKPIYRCSFCGRSQEDANRLIAGPGAVYICDSCVALCNLIINEDATASADPVFPVSDPKAWPKKNISSDPAGRVARASQSAVSV